MDYGSLSAIVGRALCAALLALPFASPPRASYAEGSRGITVELREAEAPGAPVSGSVKLYARSYALVIGIDEYRAGWPRLSNAVRDARLVAKALGRQGFEVEIQTNPDARTLEKTLEDFFLAKGDDPEARLFVWFAGHGHTERGQGYLVPADAPLPKAGLEFRRRALALRRLGEYVREARAKHILTVFDACFAGTIFDNARAAPPPAVTRVTTQPVRQFLSSGDANQTVSDDGTFRKLFLEAISGERAADANGDGYLTGSELGLFLTDRISNYTRNAQTPRYGKLRDPDWDRGDFVFRLASAVPGPAARTAPGAGGAAGTQIDREALFWQSIQASANRADFEAYLQQFPTGTFAPLARSRLVSLAPAPEKTSRPTVPGGDAEAGETSLGLSRDVRVLVQRALNDLKLDAGPADGLFGPKTRDAIRSWQRSKGFGETGYLTRDQAEALSAVGKETKVAVGVFPQPAVPQPSGPRPGETFRDCPECPEMVVVPAGSFMMGSPESEPNRKNDEGPVHRVTIPRAFGVGKYEVTKGEYAAFVRTTGRGDGDGCYVYNRSLNKWGRDGSRSWRDPGYGQTDRDPVACVSWEDAQAYVRWLSGRTGKKYRLLSEAEWEYAARAGTTTAYSTGSGIATSQANFNRAHGNTVPVGSYGANGFGLHDMHGNVFEWVEDCWNGSYSGAPSDGLAWTSGDCSFRVLRGGSWNLKPRDLRSANRIRLSTVSRNYFFGFRVARTN